MANITWLGADYQNVDKVYLPETGTGNEITFSLGGGAPSATAHTILFEFEDGTETTVIAYWDGTFISDAIRSTTPIKYDSKTVQQASLDGVAWYKAAAYTVLYNGTPTMYDDAGIYFWIPELANNHPTAGSVWRITIDGTEYNCIAQTYGHSGIDVIIGNPVHVGGTDDGSGIPVAFYNYNSQAWSGDTTAISKGDHVVKIERQDTA